MPPLASSVVDRDALKLLREWITAYRPETPRPPSND
jgi:hypothetical protein